METAGLWMLLAVALLMIITGLPAWMVLIGVALASCVIGLAAGAFSLPLLSALPARMLGLLENDLLQATILAIVGLFTAVTLGRLYAVEAAAAGGMAMFLFGLARRTLSFAILKEVLRDTMAITGALFALLVGATVFTLILRAFGTDRWVASLLAPTSAGGTYGPLLTVMLILGLCAFVLDAFEMTFVVIPVLMPPLLMRVPDATWVTVLTLLILQASFLVPPFGYAVLMLRNRLGHSIDSGRFKRALTPYLLAQLVVVGLVLAFPKLLWHDHPMLVAPAGRVLTDEEANELLRRETEPADPGQVVPLPRQE